MTQPREAGGPYPSVASREQQIHAQVDPTIKDEEVDNTTLGADPQDIKDSGLVEADLSSSSDRCQHCGQARNVRERHADNAADSGDGGQRGSSEEVRRLKNQLNRVRGELFEVFEHFMLWWHDWGWSDEPSRIPTYELVDSFRVATSLWRNEHHFDSLIGGMLQ